MRDPKKEKKSKKEVRKMFRSLSGKEYVDSFFAMGRFQARKVLADGTIVTVVVQEPGHTARPKRPTRTAAPPTKKSNHAAAAN